MTKKQEKARQLLTALQQIYPQAECALNYSSPWQLLVATILSAQCTDVRVNLVTAPLFEALPHPADMAAAPPQDVENLIRSTGFFRNKAKNLILDRHEGQVPAELDALVALNGVGRKTANVVLGNAFNIPGMVVDTHVKRLARRFGWTRHDDPVRIEKDLCRLLPAEEWTQAGHTLIAHGRACCKAPIPYCSQCPVIALCPQIGVQRSH